MIQSLYHKYPFLIIPYIFFLVDGNALLVGDFENHKYDNGGKNMWHYISISYDETTNSYKWTNNAGVSWTLYPSQNFDTLKVGTDCPYYTKGYKTAKFNQMGIYGPSNEFYTKTGKAIIHCILIKIETFINSSPLYFEINLFLNMMISYCIFLRIKILVCRNI